MFSRQEKEGYLIRSGKYNYIKRIFVNNNVQIPDKYLMLIADYIETLEHMKPDGGFYLNPQKIAGELPKLLKRVKEEPLDVYGVTDNYTITMNSKNDYETNKLFFFHELTHAIQTRMINNREECSFYNGDTGMFLTEGATQFTAEILYHMSNGTNLKYREQPNSVRGLSNHIPYSALSQYQLNGNIIMLMSSSLGIPLNQFLALGFRSDGRELLKGMYEAFPGQEGKFEEFMLDLEKIYSIDKILLTKDAWKMKSQTPSDIVMMGRKRVIKGNLQIENELINKVERELAANFIRNNDENYIIANYKSISDYLTTPDLRRNFLNSVQNIINMKSQSLGTVNNQRLS